MKMNIEQGVEAFRSTPGALLVDVRTPAEFGAGHIPGSINVELTHLDRIGALVEGFDTPLFVYCTAGIRSQQAVNYFVQAGFTNVTNIGGIASWHGDIER